jgi:hypothetical protein
MFLIAVLNVSKENTRFQKANLTVTRARRGGSKPMLNKSHVKYVSQFIKCILTSLAL